MSNLIKMLIGILSRNESFIDKLSESTPMRKAAKYTAYLYHKSKDVGEELTEKMKDAEMDKKFKEGAEDASDRFSRFSRSISDDVKDGYKNLKDEIDRDNKKN